MSGYYNKKISFHYEKSDFYGIYRRAHEVANKQLLEHFPSNTPIERIADLAIGTGKFHKLSSLNVNNLIGFDISKTMLSICSESLPRITTICDSAINSQNYLEKNSVDVIIAHYLFSYLDWRKLLLNIKPLLKPGGIISICTTTNENLSDLQATWIANLPRILNADGVMDALDLPKNNEELFKEIERIGFSVKESDVIEIPINFRHFNDVWDYTVKSGWHLQYFYSFSPKFLNKVIWRSVIWSIQRLNKVLRFPVKGTIRHTVFTLERQ